MSILTILAILVGFGIVILVWVIARKLEKRYKNKLHNLVAIGLLMVVFASVMVMVLIWGAQYIMEIQQFWSGIK